MTGGATRDITTPSVANSGTANAYTTPLTIQPGSVTGGCSQGGLCGAMGRLLIFIVGLLVRVLEPVGQLI